MSEVKALGYRDPMTFRTDKRTVASLSLTTHVMNMEMLVKANDNVAKHQYLYELMNGGDPRKSEWFLNGVAGWNAKIEENRKWGY